MLAYLLAEYGDLEGALAAIEAVNVGDPEAHRMALVSLQDLLLEHGAYEGAHAVSERLIDSGNPEAADKARFLDDLG